MVWFHEDTRSGCQKLLGHPPARSPRPKPNWLADSLSLRSKRRDPQTNGTKLTHFHNQSLLTHYAKAQGSAQKGGSTPPLLSGIFRQFQAKKHIKQNQSLSGLHVIVICCRLSRRIQAPFRAIPSKLQSNRKQWHHSCQDMAAVLTNPRHCHSLLNPIKMSACARKHCGRNVFLPAVSSHGHPVVAENKV